MSDDKPTWFGMNPGDSEVIRAEFEWSLAFELSDNLDKIVESAATDYLTHIKQRLSERPPHRESGIKFEWKQPKDRGHRLMSNPYRRLGLARQDESDER